MTAKGTWNAVLPSHQSEGIYLFNYLHLHAFKLLRRVAGGGLRAGAHPVL